MVSDVSNDMLMSRRYWQCMCHEGTKMTAPNVKVKFLRITRPESTGKHIQYMLTLSQM